MTKNIFRICAIVALGWAASQTMRAQVQTIITAPQAMYAVEGVWDVSVTVRDCSTNAVIRTVRSLQMFQHDGSVIETANTALRGGSLGVYTRTGPQTYTATFWFFRYKPDGTFASIAKAVDMVTLVGNGNQFTASGVIQDFDNNNVLISTGCFTHAANRLASPGPGM